MSQRLGLLRELLHHESIDNFHAVADLIARAPDDERDALTQYARTMFRQWRLRVRPYTRWLRQALDGTPPATWAMTSRIALKSHHLHRLLDLGLLDHVEDLLLDDCFDPAQQRALLASPLCDNLRSLKLTCTQPELLLPLLDACPKLSRLSLADCPLDEAITHHPRFGALEELRLERVPLELAPWLELCRGDALASLTSLEIWEVPLSRAHVDGLLEHLELRELCLSDCALDHRDLDALWALETSSLAFLMLDGNLIAELPDEVHFGASLRELLLSYNPLGDQGARALSTWRLPALRWLQLWWTDIGPDGARALAQAARYAWPELRRLGLGDNVLGDQGAAALAPVGADVTLELAGNQIGPVGFEALASPAHRVIAVCDNPVTAQGLEALLRCKSSPRSLKLKNCALEGASLDPLASWPGLPQCVHLNLSSNTIDAQGIAQLAGAPLERVRTLNLSQNKLDDEALAALAALDLPELRRLELGRLACSAEGIEALWRAPWIAQLYVLRASGEAWGQASWEALVGRELAWRRLVLQHAQIGSALGVVAELDLAHLEVLDLRHNPIDDDHVASLVEAPWCSTLREIELGSTSLTHTGLERVIALPFDRLESFGARELTGMEPLGVELARAPWLPHLRRLWLGFTEFHDGHLLLDALDGSAIIALDLCESATDESFFQRKAPHLPKLEMLEIAPSEAYPYWPADVLGSWSMPSLGNLRLSRFSLPAPTARLLADAPWSKHLVALELCDNWGSPGTMGALLGQRGCGRVHQLTVSHTRLTPLDLEHLAQATCAPWVIELTLADCHLDDASLAHLLRQPSWRSLTSLDLQGNTVGRETLEAIVEAPWGCKITHLLADLEDELRDWLVGQHRLSARLRQSLAEDGASAGG